MVKVKQRGRQRGGGWINCQWGFGGSEVKLPTQHKTITHKIFQTILLISSKSRGRKISESPGSTQLGYISETNQNAQVPNWFSPILIYFISQKVNLCHQDPKKLLIGFRMIVVASKDTGKLLKKCIQISFRCSDLLWSSSDSFRPVLIQIRLIQTNNNIKPIKIHLEIQFKVDLVQGKQVQARSNPFWFCSDLFRHILVQFWFRNTETPWELNLLPTDQLDEGLD